MRPCFTASGLGAKFYSPSRFHRRCHREYGPMRRHPATLGRSPRTTERRQSMLVGWTRAIGPSLSSIRKAHRAGLIIVPLATVTAWLTPALESDRRHNRRRARRLTLELLCH
jgi:hypothetical protein